jgi:CubicO group peptidase (beta-lactamase class C family)
MRCDFRSLATASFILMMPASAEARGLSIPQQIDAYIAPFAKAGHFSGTLLVAEKGKIVYEKAFGFANAELDVRNTIHTRIGAASLTKYMTIIIFGRLSEQGIVAKTDTVSKYFPSFPRGNEITLDMLLQHRSGIPLRVTTPREEAMVMSNEEMLNRIASAKLEAEPGERYLYSSAGTTLLAIILEKASGHSFGELLQKYVFSPAGMKDSIDFDAAALISRRAADYILTPSGLVNAPYKDFSFLKGAGSAYSTAGDIYRLGRAILAGTYGPGVKEELVSDGILTGSGATDGRRSFMKLRADGAWGYTLSSNLNSGANDLIMAGVETMLKGGKAAPPEVPKVTFGTLPKDYLAFVGRYLPRPDTHGLTMIVRVEDGGLFISDQQIFPTHGDCFFTYRSYGEICFTRDAQGKPNELHWRSVGYNGDNVKE